MAGIKELFYYVKEQLDSIEVEPIVFEQEFIPEEEYTIDETFEAKKESEGLFVVEGPKIERMLDYTNLETEKDLLISKDS